MQNFLEEGRKRKRRQPTEPNRTEPTMAISQQQQTPQQQQQQHNSI
jgi:hypothetical protein